MRRAPRPSRAIVRCSAAHRRKNPARVPEARQGKGSRQSAASAGIDHAATAVILASEQSTLRPRSEPALPPWRPATLTSRPVKSSQALRSFRNHTQVRIFLHVDIVLEEADLLLQLQVILQRGDVRRAVRVAILIALA